MESRAGRGRCSFDSKRGSPASNTLAVKPGAMQPLTDAQCILEAGVVSAGTALTHGSDRRGRGSHAGIADKVSKASVSYPTVWRRGYRARCAISRRLSWRWRRRRVSRLAVEHLRPEINLPGVIRWTRRRVQAVHGTLSTVRGLMPERLAGCEPTLRAFRRHLNTESVLVELRSLTGTHLRALPPPLGFRPRRPDAVRALSTHQHKTGRDPPRDPR